MHRNLLTAGLAALASIALFAAPTVQAQTVYYPPPVVNSYYAPAPAPLVTYYAPVPVVTYAAPAPVVPVTTYYTTTTTYVRPRLWRAGYATTTTYYTPVVPAPAVATTTYVAPRVFRPRVYVSSYYTPVFVP